MKKIFVLLLPLTFLLMVPHAHADVGLSITPPVSEVLISPNKSLRTTLQLTNNGEDTSVILSLHSLTPTGELGHSTIDPKPLNLSSIPIVIRLAGLELDTPIPLASNQSLPITLDLEAANLNEPTDVYFAILARPIEPNESHTLTSTTPGITALFLTTITPSASLPTNIALTPPQLPIIQDTSLPLSLDIKAENKTNIMLQVQAKVKLVSPNNATLTESNIDPKLILGNTTRLISPFTFNLSLYHFGPHTLTIELITLGGRTLTTNSYVIWLLPLRYILVTFVVILLITIPTLSKMRLTKTVKKA